ncbi:MAG: crossover junction endodeoxyribonuclease RuvC [Candidatus Abawacabacteria bacterium]|nr:crossover junction endodeoxyribonuclease RuvC [Candidatus Abawacabacteria bacterium]
MAMIKVLGIDPGTATVGYGIIKVEAHKPQFLECGVIETQKSMNMEHRLHEIGTDIAQLIAEQKPDICAVEELFFFKNITNGISVAQARGVIIYEIVKAGVPLLEFTPLEMKALITGHGHASKLQVGQMIKSILQLDTIPKPDDAADGLALAICGYLATRNKKWIHPGLQ